MKLIWQFAVQIKRILIFVLSVLGIYLVYAFLLPEVWQRNNTLFAIIAIWFFTAYIVLPRVHRLLSKFYVPDHFIARSRTSDGLLSDPVNMALIGDKRQLVAAMIKAGFDVADEINPRTLWKSIKAYLLRRSYPNAPVSDAFLFGNKQVITFQKEVDGNPHQRHHVRFWRTPRSWYLPGGFKVDWLGAATYDRAGGASFTTAQFTHLIDSDVDKERDYMIEELNQAKTINKIQKIEHFSPGYTARNGFGHHYQTDGSMVIAQIRDSAHLKA
ncbi:MAG: LssY C-terminal domain-containing protein [bacterium]|nr:LssY C-terminal domain-containing protein [bacterium]